MDGVASTAPDPIIPVFLKIFTLIEDRSNTTPQARLERIAALPLGKSPPLVVCLEAPDPHICILWGTQFVTLYFSQPTPEDGKVLAFARDIRLGLIPATVVVQPEWITTGKVVVLRARDMEALIASLALGHPRLPADTPRR